MSFPTSGSDFRMQQSSIGPIAPISFLTALHPVRCFCVSQVCVLDFIGLIPGGYKFPIHAAQIPKTAETPGCDAFWGWGEKLEYFTGKPWDLPCNCGLSGCEDTGSASQSLGNFSGTGVSWRLRFRRLWVMLISGFGGCRSRF